jgi:hypothetical protein
MELRMDRRHLLISERFVLRKLFETPEVIANLIFNNDTHRKQFKSPHCHNFISYRVHHPRRPFVLVWGVYLAKKKHFQP